MTVPPKPTSPAEVRAAIHIRRVYREEYERMIGGDQAFVVLRPEDRVPGEAEAINVRELDDATGDPTGREFTADITAVVRQEIGCVLGCVVGFSVRRFEKAPAKILRVLQLVAEELSRAMKANPNFRSPHEGFAVMLEEVDELKEQVWLKPIKRDPKKMGGEAIQVAAMGVKFVLDCSPEVLNG